MVDLVQLESIDAPALRELVEGSHRIRSLGITLALVSPQPDVDQMPRLLNRSEQ